MSGEIRPFRVEVAEAVLEDLRLRLALTRWPDTLEGAGWTCGTDLNFLRELTEYWLDKYDWRQHEHHLNELSQFKTRINDLDVHFVHVRSPEPDALPLVITHGWPGSIYEFMDIVGPLADPSQHGGDRRDAFHVVCPSMPGYGFSDAPRRLGFSIKDVAETSIALMERLGYPRYGAQGGDWGAIASTWIARLDPQRCAGIHLNMVPAGPPSVGDISAAEETAAEDEHALAGMAEFQRDEAGYAVIQGTRPQTLGYALNDSPAGLAAWIVEKFRSWSDCQGDVESCFTKDQLLTNVMIYWVTGSITSSTRLYFEHQRLRAVEAPGRVEVATGCAVFPADIFRPPRRWADAAYNVTHWSEMPSGGHFAAMEAPELLVDDIRTFFRPLR